MITYRKATFDDMEDLLRVRIDFLADAGGLRSDSEKEQMRDNYREYLIEVFSNGSFVQWLAMDEQAAAATGSVSLIKLPPNNHRPNGKVGYIANMFTYPQYRGQGLATKLLALSVQEAVRWGCAQVQLNATDMGRPIYEKFGFKKSPNDMVYYVL